MSARTFALLLHRPHRSVELLLPVLPSSVATLGGVEPVLDLVIGAASAQGGEGQEVARERRRERETGRERVRE